MLRSHVVMLNCRAGIINRPFTLALHNILDIERWKGVYPGLIFQAVFLIGLFGFLTTLKIAPDSV